MRCRCVWAAGAAIVLASCSPVEAPRRAEAAAVASVIDYPSPRVEFRVQDDPDIGNVTFRGTVGGRNPTVVNAPSDGRVLEVLVSNDDLVAAGDAILRFLPAPSEAELIELQIAELTITKAVAENNAAEQADAERARDNLVASFEDRVETVVSPSSGVLTGSRQNVEYTVSQDRALFKVASQQDLVVDVRLRANDTGLVTLGAPVAMTRSGNDAQTLTGTIATIAEPESGADSGADLGDVLMTVELDDAGAVALGDRLSVSLAASSDAESVWIPLEAVGRQSGAPYVLIASDTSGLERRQVVLGRQTQTHVQVLSTLSVGLVLVAPQ